MKRKRKITRKDIEIFDWSILDDKQIEEVGRIIEMVLDIYTYTDEENEKYGDYELDFGMFKGRKLREMNTSSSDINYMVYIFDKFIDTNSPNIKKTTQYKSYRWFIDTQS